MMPLIPPITDRTASDVNYATHNQSNSPPNKGALNYTDLNRIEANCAYLAEQLTAYGYDITITVKTDWTMQDFHYLSQVDRIRGNVDLLLDAFHRLPGSPEIRYWNSLDWTDVNSLEQNIKNIDILLQRMAAVFLRCGDAHGGDR